MILNIFKKKTCKICGKEISFLFVISPQLPERNSRKKTGKDRIFCRDHFIEEFEKIIRDFEFPFVFVEPLDEKGSVPSVSQNFFYIIEDMEKDYFKKEDQEEVRKILNHTNKEKPIIWLDKDILGNIEGSDVFLKTQPRIVSLDKKELINKLKNTFLNYPLNKKGRYQINLPYDGPGIFLYYNYL